LTAAHHDELRAALSGPAPQHDRWNGRTVAREASPVALTLLSWWSDWLNQNEGKDTWEGATSELLGMVNGKANEGTQRLHGWPKTPEKLSSQLFRLMPNVISAGMRITKLNRSSAGRLWRIEKVATRPSQPSGPSQAANNAGATHDGSMTGDDGLSDNRHTNRHGSDAIEFRADDGHDGHDGSAGDSSDTNATPPPGPQEREWRVKVQQGVAAYD
jgi:hypothetical protein